jgi:hypothetical protein
MRERLRIRFPESYIFFLTMVVEMLYSILELH